MPLQVITDKLLDIPISTVPLLRENPLMFKKMRELLLSKFPAVEEKSSDQIVLKEGKARKMLRNLQTTKSGYRKQGESLSRTCRLANRIDSFVNLKPKELKNRILAKRWKFVTSNFSKQNN